jgi:hypothetical protein
MMERVRRKGTKWEQARGEAVTLWRLERAHEHLRCFIVEPPRGFWVGVERGADLIFSDTYADLDDALMRAEGLKSPLLVAGWTEPEDR